MIDEITNPALRAVVLDSNQEGLADLAWSDGEQLRVRYDIVVPADESADGIEEVVVEVITVLAPGMRCITTLVPGRRGVVRADDPPVSVRPA